MNRSRGLVFIGACIVVMLISLRWIAATESVSGLASWSAYDGSYVAVAVVEWLNSGGFSNSLTNFYTEPHWRDGQFSMVGYTPVHMLLLAILSPTEDVHGVFIAIWKIDAAGLVLFFLSLVVRLSRSEEGVSPLSLSVVVLAMICLATLGFSGRPGSSFVLFLSLGLLYLSVESKPLPVMVGMVLGLLGATQPTAGLIVAACVVVWVGMRSPTGQASREITAIACIAFVIAMTAIGTWYAPSDVIAAMNRNLPAHFFTHFTPRVFLESMFLDWKRPLSGLVLVAGFVAFVLLAIRTKPHSLFWFLAGTVALVSLSAHAFIIRPYSTYNIQALYPILLTLSVMAAMASRTYAIASLVLLGFAALAMPLQGIVLFDQIQRGVSLRTAQSSYASIIDLLPRSLQIGIDPALWGLSRDGSDWDRSFYINWDGPRNRDASNAVLFTREGAALNRGDLLEESPVAQIEHVDKGIKHRLWLDCNTHRKMNLLGKTIYAPVEGFAFSVYVPEKLNDWCPPNYPCRSMVAEIAGCRTVSPR